MRRRSDVGGTPHASAVARLARALLDPGRDPALADELARWLASSPRFGAFAEAHEAKIRKKLRGAADAEALRDVRAELLAARLLLADRRLELAFEAYGSARGGPDFTITFRATRTLNLEITRLRRVPDAAGLAGALVAKLRQLPPGTPNVLVVAIDGSSAANVDVEGAVRAVRARADARDEAFLVARGFDGTRAFYDRFLRLGVVIAWCEGAEAEARAAPWVNRSARIAVPDRALEACLTCLRASAEGHRPSDSTGG